ncbi:MAG: hypothetical protein Tsb0019_32200 [Roseibium sp.]
MDSVRLTVPFPKRETADVGKRPLRADRDFCGAKNLTCVPPTVTYIGGMTSASFRLGKFVAALFLAFVVSFAGLMPGHSSAAASGHMSLEKSGSPCGKSMAHGMHSHGEPAADVDEDPVLGDCCDGTFCAGDTVRSSEMTLSGVLYEVSFVRVPPDALQRADLSLPHRPPRNL